MLTHAVSKLMEALDKEALAVAVSFAALAPYLGLPFGCYLSQSPPLADYG